MSHGEACIKEHAKSLPYIEEIYANDQGLHKALFVPDALFCAVCRPREDPVELPDLT